MTQVSSGGKLLRQLRTQAGLTLDDVAGASGVTKSYLSKVERGQSVPSIAVAIALAEVFGVDVATLFGPSASRIPICVVRAGERRAINGLTATPPADATYEGIAATMLGKRMLPFVAHPSRRSGTGPLHRHVGDEMVFAHRGHARLEFPDRTVELAPGDAVYFDGQISHRLSADEGTAVELLVIISADGDAQVIPEH